MALSWAYIDSNGTSSAGGPHKSIQYRTYDVFSGSSDLTLTTGSSGGSATVMALKGKLSGAYGLNVGGLIDFSSNVATSGTLEVDKSVFVSGALNVTGAITSKGITSTGALRSDGSLLVSGALNVTGTTTLASDLIVNESAFISGALNVTGTITATHGYFTELDVTNINSVTVTETTLEVVDKLILVASGTTSANAAGGGMQIGGTSSGPPGDEARFVWGHAESAMSLNKALNVTGNVHTSGSAQIYGGLLLSGALNVTGAASLAADVIIGESAFVSGGLNVTGAVTAKAINSTGATLSNGSLLLSGALNVTGAASLAADVIIGESLFISGALNVTGAATATALISTTAMSGAGGISGQSLTVQQNVTGAAALQGQTLAIQAGMTITGSSVHHGAFSVTNKISGSGFTSNETGINVSKNADISGTLLVQKAGFVSGALNVSGNVTSNGLVINTAAAASTIAGIQADSLTTGKAFNITSNSDDTSGRTLMQITNDNASATGARVLYIVNDAIASSIGQTVLIETTAADTNPLLELRTSNTATDKPPILAFHRTDSDTEADDMSLGTVAFRGKDSGNAETDYVKIEANASDITNNDEGGKLTIKALAGGTAGTAGLKNLLSVGGEDVANSTACEVVINDDSVDCDFRVESDGNSNMLFVDAGNDSVGIGTASPQSLLHVSSSTESLAGEKLFEVDGKALGSVLFATGSGRVGIRTNTPTAPLSVVGTISSSAGLMIAGPASFSGDLELSGAAFVSGALNVTGAATVTDLISTTAMSGAGGISAQSLTVQQNVTGAAAVQAQTLAIQAGMTVTGSSIHHGAFTVTNKISGSGFTSNETGINVSKNADVSGTLLVQKAGFVSGALNVSGALTSKGVLLADGGAAATPASGFGALYVTSDVLYFKTDGGSATNLLAGGSGGAVANYNNNGNNRILTSVDSDTINGEANLLFDGSTLSSSVGGIFVGGLIISNNIDMTGTLLVQKAAFVSGALNVSGAATATSLLSLTAMSGAGGLSAQTLTTDGQISGAAGLSVVGGIVCDSSIDLTGTLLVQKAAFVSGALNVSGTITADSFSVSTAMSGAGGLLAQSLTVQQNVTGAAAVQAQTLAIQAGMTVTGSSIHHGTFSATKAQSAAVTATSADIDVGDNHFFIIFEGSSAATASLPAVSGKAGRMYHFANQSSNDSHFVIDGNASEQVNNGLGHTMEHGGATIGLICDGAQWVLFTAYEQQEE